MFNKCKLMFLSLIIAICFCSCCCDYFNNDNKNNKGTVKIKIIDEKFFNGNKYFLKNIDGLNIEDIDIKDNIVTKFFEENKIKFKEDKKHLLAIVGIKVNENLKKCLVYIPGCNINKYQGPFLDNQNIIYVNILSIGEEIKKLENLFCGCKNLKTVDLSKLLDTSNVTDMSGMFERCECLTEIEFPEGFGSACEDMSGMFSVCYDLRTVYLSKLDTSNVKYMSYMFSQCNSLTKIEFPADFGSACWDMSYMFLECGCSNVDLSNFNTKNVTNMSYMFCGCIDLTEIKFPKGFGSACTNMSSMFNSCSSLEKIISPENLDTSKVEYNDWMFFGCDSLSEDIKNKFLNLPLG